jgi:hypothetical protein
MRRSRGEGLTGRKTAGLFHSMSARTAMKHAIEIGWCWDALVLLDPPNVPPSETYAAMEVLEHKLPNGHISGAGALLPSRNWLRSICSHGQQSAGLQEHRS